MTNNDIYNLCRGYSDLTAAMRALWKSIVKKEREEKYSQFYEAEDAYAVMERLVSACDEHLSDTSLEYLASATERCILPEGLTRGGLEKDTSALKTMFLESFPLHNLPRKDLKPTKNELQFMALARAHYVSCARGRGDWATREVKVRTAPAADSIRALLDARIRLGCAMSTHGHVIKGVPYETAEQRRARREEERMDRLCPLDHTINEWEELRQKQRMEEAKEVEEEQRKALLIREAVQVARHMKKRKAPADDLYEWDNEDPDEEPIPKGDATLLASTFPPPAPYPDLEDLFDEVSFFLTTYWVEGNEEVAKFVELDKEIEPSPECVKARDALTNSASGGDLGMCWADNCASSYLIMATAFFAASWTEYMWKAKFPVRDVQVPLPWMEGFASYIIDRLEIQLQDETCKMFSSASFEMLMPIGARSLVQRMLGARGGAARKLVYRLHSVAVVAECDELISTESAIRLIGYDESHPLFDALAATFVAMSCFGEHTDFSMIDRCTVATSDLIQRGRAFDLKGPLRRPLITRLCGEWLVHDCVTDQWIRPFPNKFSSSWMVLLSLLKESHRYSMDSMTDLSYWDAKLGTSLHSLG
jgi:hypothetical protein